MVHHLQNVAPKPGKGEPKIISRMVDILATMVKPAGPTQKTQQMIQGNAENWEYNTLTILMDHYKEDFDQTLEELDNILIPDWKSAFQFATRWARRSLQRVTPDVLDHAEALIAVQGIAKEGQDEQPQPLGPGRITVAVQMVQEDPRPVVRVQKMPLRPDLVKEPIRRRPMVNSSSMTIPLLDTKGEEKLPSFQVPCEQRPPKKLFFSSETMGGGVILREEVFPQ